MKFSQVSALFHSKPSGSFCLSSIDEHEYLKKLQYFKKFTNTTTVLYIRKVFSQIFIKIFQVFNRKVIFSINFDININTDAKFVLKCFKNRIDQSKHLQRSMALNSYFYFAAQQILDSVALLRINKAALLICSPK